MRNVSLAVLMNETVWIHKTYKNEDGSPFQVSMPVQNPENYYLVQQQIIDLLLTLPPNDNQRTK